MIQTSVQKMMREWNMVSSGDRLLAAVSGGADSVCLLLVLKDLQKSMGFSLEAIHVEHGIRGEESLQDQRFVQELCDSLEVPLTCVAVDVLVYRMEHGLSEEEAARELRYWQFSRVAAQKNAKVVLAHHMEDNAETVLFQMVRGSRMTGMCGIRPMRTDEKGVTYLRPMLWVHREEIEQELERRGQSFCVDRTNLELEYSRNYLRNEVLPRLAHVNEQAVAHINEMSWYMAEIDDFLETETVRAWNLLVQEHRVDGIPRGVGVVVDKLKELHPVIQKELLMKMVIHIAGNRKDITSSHIGDLLTLCDKQSGKEVHLPYQLMGKKVFDTIVVMRVVKPMVLPLSEFEVSEADLEQILFSGETLEISLGKSGERLRLRIFGYDKSSMEIPKKAYTKWLDYDNIKQGFCIRVRQNGDYFISDATGHHKKLQNYFVDEKIPMEERAKMWLLAQDSYVLWLIGGRISENAKVTENTQFVVELEYIGGNENGFYKEA